MRLLSVVVQNKKGENVLIAAAGGLLTRTCLIYSRLIYEHILETYRRRDKIERTLTVALELRCVLSINKEYILYVFVKPADLSLAFDAVRKINEFMTGNAKMFAASSAAQRLQTVSRKFVEFMSALQQFLLTRQITLREYLPLSPQPHSRKKTSDLQFLGKFSHLSQQGDRKILLETQMNSNRIEQIEVRKRLAVEDMARNLFIKNQDELDLLDVDPEKEAHLNRYRRNIVTMALCARKKQSPTIPFITSEVMTLPQELPEEQEGALERQKIRLRMMEKLELMMQNAKVKEVHQYGQLLVEGTTKEKAYVSLRESEAMWNNPKLLNRRISPASLQTVSEKEQLLTFTTNTNYRSMAILDYIIRRETFLTDKIPLLFVYTMEVSSSNIEFTFKYKTNDKWKHRLFDVDIIVALDKQFVVTDCKSVPSAHSLKNNKVNWKTKEIIPNSALSKGKIILAFASSNVQPKKIIRQIRLSMKSQCGLLEGLTANCHQDWGHVARCQKTLLIDYRIAPND